MKTYKEFIKEINHIQEKLDATVYGQLTLGATPGTATKQQIKSGVDRAIKNVGKKEGSGQIGTKGSYGIKPSGYVSLSYEKKSGVGKTPPPTKTKPTPTTTKTTPTPTKIRPPKPTPTTSTPSPSTNVLTKGSGTSSTSTSTSTQSSTKIRDPRTAKISDIRMGRM